MSVRDGWVIDPRIQESAEGISRSMLMELGFQEHKDNVYTKSFSGLLELLVHVGTKHCHYSWRMDIQEFKLATGDLRRLKDFIEEEADKLASRHKPEDIILKKRSFQRDLDSVSKSLWKRKTAFRKDYQAFIDLIESLQTRSPYFSSRCFPLDACRSTVHTRAFLDFVKLYMEVLAEQPGKYPRGNPTDLLSAIVYYYLTLYAIKKIRRLWMGRRTQDELRRQFPMFTEKQIDRLTLDAGQQKGWESKAQQVALGKASARFGMTPDSLRQMKKQECQVARQIRSRVMKIDDVERQIEDEGYAHLFRDLRVQMKRFRSKGRLVWSIKHSLLFNLSYPPGKPSQRR